MRWINIASIQYSIPDIFMWVQNQCLTGIAIIKNVFYHEYHYPDDSDDKNFVTMKITRHR